jgi:hypothetical protein
MRSKYLSKRRREVDGRVEKFCRGCSEWKPLEQLVKDPVCQDGIAPRCKVCENARWELNKMRREERRAG